MKTRTRPFLAPATALKPLKEGQVRCPLCCKGVKINARTGTYATHKADGYSCPVNTFPVSEVDRVAATA